MIHYKMRCKHCNSLYTWQASGEGCLEKTNDKDYCSICKQVILDALKNIPIKYRCTSIPTTEVTLEELEDALMADIKSNKGMKIYPSLYSEDGKERQICRSVKIGDKEYIYSYWPSKKEEADIRIFVEENIETGEIRECLQF